MAFRVMQRTETGEEFHADCPDFETVTECFDWIDENADQYEESEFWIENIE